MSRCLERDRAIPFFELSVSERPGHTNHLCTSGEFVAHQVPAGLDVDLDATIGEVDAGEVGATETCCVTTSDCSRKLSLNSLTWLPVLS